MIVDSSNEVLFGLCGLGVVCAGLLFVGLLVLARFTGSGLFAALAVLSRNLLSRDRTPPAMTLPRRRSDLRAKAQAVDFDAALAQAQRESMYGAETRAQRRGTPPSTESRAYDLDAPDVNPRRSFPDDDVLYDEDGML